MSYIDTDFEAPAAASHTPGPWHVGVKTYHAGRDVYGPKGESVAITDDVMTNIDEAKANARLIAAAPDLLGELRNIVENAWQYDDDAEAEYGDGPWTISAETYERIKALVVRAEGRE